MTQEYPMMNGLLTLPVCFVMLGMLASCTQESKSTAKKVNEEVEISEDGDAETGFQDIFDGKTLNGWEGNLDWFRVEDGAIIAGSLEKEIPNNEFLCTTSEHEDFELRLEARLIGMDARNAGIQFRSMRIKDHHEVRGYQCDMGVIGENNIWGWMYDESRRRKFLVEAPQKPVVDHFKKDDWNEIVIRCEGPKIQISVNGVTTVDYTEEDPEIERSGIIGLQVHGGPAQEASYRQIRIKSL